MFKPRPLVDALFAIGLARPRIRPQFDHSPFGLYRPTVTFDRHRLSMRWAPGPL